MNLPLGLSCRVLIMMLFIGGSVADPKIRTTSGSVEIDADSLKVGLLPLQGPHTNGNTFGKTFKPSSKAGDLDGWRGGRGGGGGSLTRALAGTPALPLADP